MSNTTAISELYPSADWSDTSGPGCGAVGHDESCLCDVDLALAPPADHGRNLWHGWAHIATEVQGGTPRTGGELHAWAAEMLGAFDTVSASCDTRALLDAAHAWAASDDISPHPSHRAPAKTAALAAMTAHGLDLEGVCLLVAESPETVLKAAFPRVDPDTALAVVLGSRGERWSPRSLGACLGLDEKTVRNILAAFSTPTPQAVRQSMGGGWKLTSEQVQWIVALRADGHSMGAIADQTGVPKSTVAQTLKREAARQAAA